MARRLGALAPRRAEDSEDVLDRSLPGSPRSKSQQYPTFYLLFAMVIFVLFYVFGNSGNMCKILNRRSVQPAAFHPIHLEEPRHRHMRRATFGAVEEESGIGRAEETDTNVDELVTLRDGDRLSSRPECRANICDAIPILQEVYGKILHRTLHIGPGTCGVVSKLLKEDDVEVWGIQPFDMMAPIHPLCENFVRKGIIRVSDPYRPLPYRKKSFSLVLVTGTLDEMKPKELNQTLSNLASLSSHSLMLVVGSGVQRPRRKDIGKPQKPLKSRNRIWWQRRLAMVGLKEDAEHSRRFEDLQSERSYKTNSNIFHLHASGDGQLF